MQIISDQLQKIMSGMNGTEQTTSYKTKDISVSVIIWNLVWHHLQ